MGGADHHLRTRKGGGHTDSQALPPEKKPFHERFWWLPAAIGLIAIAASGAGVLIAALA